MIPDISIVVPVFNEAESLTELCFQIEEVLQATGATFEIIFVDDGSSDRTMSVLNAMQSASVEQVRVIHFEYNQGKATAMGAGFKIALGRVFITMDGDLQDDPKEIPRFLAAILEGHDLVIGWKLDRKDSFIKNTTSKVYNLVASLVSGVPLHDHNCGFKAFRREVAISLPMTGQLHRYIPMLARARGFTAITEIVVNHRRRSYGKSKYGFMRFIHGLTGLGHAMWVTRKISRASLAVDRGG